ncbi:hypothetical protein HII31_01262 [Pseudocercospora fuligena]|uniref:Uncharacterized protein n=1 Tax=Pseudocercospora fuligena TaxID=685502 RepID=A0A8H6RV36_9PEZI|nr:hypothetical protein HII31_01262 [Pseudocercospora fuligena]
METGEVCCYSYLRGLCSHPARNCTWAGEVRLLLPLHSHLKHSGTHIRGASWGRSELFHFASLIPKLLGFLIGLLGTSHCTMGGFSPLNFTFFPTAMGKNCKPHFDISISCSSQLDFFLFFPLTPTTTFVSVSTLLFSFPAFDNTSPPLLLQSSLQHDLHQRQYHFHHQRRQSRERLLRPRGVFQRHSRANLCQRHGSLPTDAQEQCHLRSHWCLLPTRTVSGNHFLLWLEVQGDPGVRCHRFEEGSRSRTRGELCC